MTELEELEKQVAEMQAIIARMKQETKPEQWEPQGGEWYVDFKGVVDPSGTSDISRLFGSEYQTKEQAVWAAKQMRSFNRLLCYVAEHTDGIPDDININNVVITVPFEWDKRVELLAKIQSGEVVL